MKYASILATVSIAAFSGLCAQDPPGAAFIETPCFRFTVRATDGHCEIIDKEANVTWHGEAGAARFG